MAFRKEFALSVVIPLILSVFSVVAGLALPKLNLDMPDWMPLAAFTFALLCVAWAWQMGRKLADSTSTSSAAARRGGGATVFGDRSEGIGGDAGTAGRGGDATVRGDRSRAVGGKGGDAVTKDPA